MSTDHRTLIAEARKLAEAATPGPWFVVGAPWGDETYAVQGRPDPHGRRAVLQAIEIDEVEAESSEEASRKWAEAKHEQCDNLAFACDARTRVPDLCDALEAALSEADTLRGQVAALREALAATWPGIAEEEGFTHPGGNIVHVHKLAQGVLSNTAAAAIEHDNEVRVACAEAMCDGCAGYGPPDHDYDGRAWHDGDFECEARPIWELMQEPPATPQVRAAILADGAGEKA